ncbi:MAG: AAA family ATPase [Chitinophagaceae bacterium]
MKLHIANLGAVKEATIDLSKKLIVFSGPNGTGKTYAAYVVYAVTNLKNKGLFFPSSGPDWRTLFDTGKEEKTIHAQDVYHFRKNEIERVCKEANNIFSVSEERRDEFFGDFQMDTCDSEEEFALEYHAKQISATINFGVEGFRVEKLPNSNKVIVEIQRQDIGLKEFNGFVHHALYGQVLARLAFSPITANTILPVERNSIYTFAKELSLRRQTLVDQMQAVANSMHSVQNENALVDLLFKRSVRYPEPIREALIVADDLTAISKIKGPYYSFAKDLEGDVLNGSVIIGKDGDVQFASNRAKTKKLSIYLSSSSVKTLSSLVIYLKHIAQPNDLIIIDEPELNLHPDNQILLARLFARLINKGLRLLISTHSDYIIRELNNLIMLSSKEPRVAEVAKEYGYQHDEHIAPDDIGAYLFHFKKSNSRTVIVEDIPVADNGFEVSTIEATIKSMNEVSEELFYNLRHGNRYNEQA